MSKYQIRIQRRKIHKLAKFQLNPINSKAVRGNWNRQATVYKPLQRGNTNMILIIIIRHDNFKLERNYWEFSSFYTISTTMPKYIKFGSKWINITLNILKIIKIEPIHKDVQSFCLYLCYFVRSRRVKTWQFSIISFEFKIITY